MNGSIGARVERITANMVARHFAKRPDDSNKSSFGSVCVIGGCANYVGAPQFSAMSSSAVRGALARYLTDCGTAAMLSGTGTSTLAVPDFLAEALYDKVLYSAVYPLKSNGKHIVFDKSQADELISRSSAFAIGMGAGAGETDKFAEYILTDCERNFVIDADALFKTKNLKFSHRAVLTPHIGEMSRLTGLNASDIKSNAAEIAAEYANRREVVVVLKDNITYISDGDRVLENAGGNAKLAKGGSGDVLSGIIAAMLGFGTPLIEAAAAGCYILGRAAEKSGVNEYSHLPVDTVARIADVIEDLCSLSID